VIEVNSQGQNVKEIRKSEPPPTEKGRKVKWK
jgi:hypothetical protein